MGDVIRAGLVGVNGIGEKHGGWMETTGRFKVAAVTDVDESMREKAAESFPDAAFYTDAEEMFNNTALDVVTISTPHNLHAPLTHAALKAGINVVVEKPMATTYEDAEAMIETANQQNRVLTVFHNRRLDPFFLATRSALEEGLIGNLFESNIYHCISKLPARWRRKKETMGGTMFDWGAHLVDYALHFHNSSVTSVSGRFYRSPDRPKDEIADHGTVCIYFESGAVANITTSFAAYKSPYRYRLLGTQGTLMDYWDDNPEVIIDRGLKGGEKATMRVTYPSSDTQVTYYKNLADHLENDEPLLVTPTSAAQVINVLCTGERSAHQGGTPLPLAD